MGQGTVYECFNLASLWSLPLLFVLEDNQYAQSTPKKAAQAGEISRRAEPFGIETAAAPGEDPTEVWRAARRARETVASTLRPYFLALDTYRLSPHSKGDDTRPAEEIEAHRQRDPLRRLAERLPAETREGAEAEARRRVAEAIRRAEESRP